MSLTMWSSSHYTFPLPEGHRFPIAKYAMLREAVIAEGIVPADRVLDPPRADDDALTLVHTADYVRRFREGALGAAELRRIGFPWSPGLVERSYRAVGGTIAATRRALAHGLAMNLAGGTHHAFPDHGEGFCVFNDVAVAIRLLQRDRLVRRVAIVDLDVHQGNGTHAIFAADDDVYTFSMHGGRNYPFQKFDGTLGHSSSREVVVPYGVRVPGDLDINLQEGVKDDEYLSLLYEALPRVLARSSPDLVLYLAGADPHEGDRLGRMKLSFDGLARRDSFVIETCREAGIPVAITIAGGYGKNIDDTVPIHVRTAQIASDFA